MKEDRCFSYNKRDYTTYNYLKKEKIIAISENVNKDCES